MTYLKIFREKRGLTQKQVAQALKKSVSYYGRLERNDQCCDNADIIYGISLILGVPFAPLLLYMVGVPFSNPIDESMHDLACAILNKEICA